jgi:hypothetical protein
MWKRTTFQVGNYPHKQLDPTIVSIIFIFVLHPTVPIYFGVFILSHKTVVSMFSKGLSVTHTPNPKSITKEVTSAIEKVIKTSTN